MAAPMHMHDHTPYSFRVCVMRDNNMMAAIQRRLDTHSLTCAVTCLLLHFITFHVAFQLAISSLRR